MRKLQYILLLFLISFNGLSQQTGLNDNGNKITLNYLSLQGGTLTGTLTATAGIQNVGTFTNTGNITNTGTIISSGTIATSSNIVAGSATTTSASAVLEANSATQGFMPPRIALTASNVFSPIVGTSAAAAGLLVYNTATAGSIPNNVVPGYYYWNGSLWVQIAGGFILDNSKSASFSLATTDNNKIFLINSASAVTVTVPSLAIAFNCQFIQLGAGTITLAVSGTTLNSSNGLTTRTTNSVIGLIMNSATNGYVFGDTIF